MNKNILVTGGAGYIGSNTVKALVEKGFNIIVVDDLSTGYRELIHPSAKFYQNCILDTKQLSKILVDERISGIIHFAAKIIVPESITHSLAYYRNNTQGVLSILEAAKASNVKNFVFSSTAAVYGDSKSNLVSEYHPTQPLNPYGHSKLMSEQVIKDAEIEFGLRYVILRYFNVAGASECLTYGQLSKNASHLIKIASETACGKRNSMNITGTNYNTPDGTGVRDYIHVEDLADIHVLSMKYLQEGKESTILNCGYGKGFSVKEVIQTIKKVSGKDFLVSNAPRRLGDSESLVADITKIQKALNWSPKKASLELICKSSYEWEKKLNN
jgi:UDP-glucose 4-epimerase